MTITQFLKAFERKRKRTRRKFTVPKRGRTIRTQKVYHGGMLHCPISFVAEVAPCAAGVAGRKLKMRGRDVDSIVESADWKRGPLRTKLLKAAGIKERA